MKRLLARITAAFDGAASANKDGGRIGPNRAEAGSFAAHPAADAQGEHDPSALLLRTKLRLPRRLDVAFDRHLVGEGWHDCETAGDLPFRWMGLTESATVWLAIDRSVPLAFDLAIYIIIEPTFADRIGVAVGEPPEPVVHERTVDGLSFVLPPAPDHIGPTKITLRAPGLVPGPDPRCLSIACSRLRVRPLDTGIAETGHLTLHTALSRHLPDRAAAARAAVEGDRCEVHHLE